MKVAVIGASGIGKHHAKWFHLEGCEVVAFAGSSKPTVERTAQSLKDLFGFQGRGYVDPNRMIEETEPDIVAVASPPDLHFEHALAVLNAGVHLYCEKPLVWDEGKTESALQSEARQICETAEASLRTFGINTQYVAALPDYLAVCGFPAEVRPYPDSFYMKMESKGGNTSNASRRAAGGEIYGRHHKDLWIDLASHPISLLMKWCPQGRVEESSVHFRLQETQCRCRFDFVSPTGTKTKVEIELGNLREGTPARRFGVDGHLVDYEGRNDANGVYRTYLKYGNHEITSEDFMRKTVRAYLQSIEDSSCSPLVTGAEGVRNLEIQLQLLRFA